MTAPLGKEFQSFRLEKAVRKDSAVHVSLSSDSLVKQPGNPAVSKLPGASREADEIRTSDFFSEACPHISEELQRRAITP